MILKGQIKMDLSSIQRVKTEKKTISNKWKQALQEYCDTQSLETGLRTGYCVSGYMKYCDLCDGGNMELSCVKAILKLAKIKGLKINDKNYNFEKLLEEL